MNKFLSILVAVGKDALTVAGLMQTPLVRQVEGLAPVAVQPALGKLNSVIAEIATAQKVGAAIEAQLGTVTPTPGQSTLDIDLAKAKAVLPSVMDILRQAEFMTGRTVADADLFTTGSQKILDGFVDVLNSVEHPTPVARQG